MKFLSLFFLVMLLLFSSCFENLQPSEETELTYIGLAPESAYSYLYRKVLEPRCIGCHDWASDEEELISRIEFADPMKSLLLTAHFQDEKLIQEDKKRIESYIEKVMNTLPGPEPEIDLEYLEQVKSEILIPKCIRCHKWMRKNDKIFRRIIVGDPENSRLYKRVIDNSMPIGAPPLSDEEKQAIYELISGS